MPGVLAVDIGGTGSRARYAPSDGPSREVTGRGLSVGRRGVVVGPLVADLVERLEIGPGEVVSACLGVSGLISLGEEPAELHRSLRDMLAARTTVVASDAVTSAAGALGGRAGAVLLTGTGSTALGTDLEHCWYRVDGWGHVLGDHGSGAWIGARGLSAAMEQHDGRRTDAAALLRAANARFGAPESLTRQVYTREDRAGLLASFAPDVVELARAGDPAAEPLVTEAAHHLARALAAALRPPVPPVASYVGGVFRAGAVLEQPFLRQLRTLVPGVEVVPASGTALDGATAMARRVARSPTSVATHLPLISVESAAGDRTSAERKKDQL